jgi:hypothetical protein
VSRRTSEVNDNRSGTDAVRATPVPVFAGLLALLVAVRLVTRWRRSHAHRQRPSGG